MNLSIELYTDEGEFLGGIEAAVTPAELVALPRLLTETLGPAAAQLRTFYEHAVARRLQTEAGRPHTDTQMN
jgi:hypothetical protein